MSTKPDPLKALQRADAKALVKRLVLKRRMHTLALAEDAAARQATMTEEDVEQSIARIVDDVKDAAD